MSLLLLLLLRISREHVSLAGLQVDITEGVDDKRVKSRGGCGKIIFLDSLLSLLNGSVQLGQDPLVKEASRQSLKKKISFTCAIVFDLPFHDQEEE